MKKLAKIAGVLLLLLVLALILWPRNDGAISDADLQLVPVEVAEQDNGFHLIEEAGKKVSATDPEKNRLSDYLREEGPIPEDMARILQENSEAVTLFRRGVAMPELQVPRIRDFNQLLPYLGQWKSLALLAQLNARATFQKSDEKGGFDQALEIVEFGHRAQDCSGTWIHYLAGVAIKSIGCREIREMAAATTLKPHELQPYIDKLGRYASNYTGLTNAIKTEYRLQADAIDQMKGGQFPGTTNSTIARVGIAVLNKPLFNPKATRELFAGLARTNLVAVARPYNEMQLNSQRIGSTNLVQLVMSGNMAGKTLASMLMPADQKFMERKCNENVEIAATQLLLALRCYQMQRGTLPDSLDALVPDYIAAIPLDDFDGKPMKYSARTKTVYSVGKDLIDSGGKGKEKNSDTSDIVYKVEF